MFCQKIKNYKKRGYPLIYLDESGFANDMPRTHGYSLKGQRCYGTHDWGSKGRTNAIGALFGKKLLTVSLFESNIDTEIFTTWVKKDLLPKIYEKSVIIMDNASFHKGEEMKISLNKAGHDLVYLPTYSPDLNPIEKKWSQAKAMRRKKRCSIEDLFKNNDL